jgi:hypothetical protein
MSIILDGTSGITSPNETITGSLNTPNTFGFKNRIINGGMVIDQRNAGASVSLQTTTSYVLDRWISYQSQNSKLTCQQNAGSVTPPAGFSNYMGFTSQSAYSVLSTDYFVSDQLVEGFNTADLAWGTASAKSVTLSFWVYSSLTGTFGGSLCNNAANRWYVYSYTIPTANTWTQIYVTIPGDTTGTWLTTNLIGIRLRFSLGIGSTYTGTAGSWGSTIYYGPTGTQSVVGTSGATFYITGVQLELGAVATSFDQRAYSQELAMCQRYYQLVACNGRARAAGATHEYEWPLNFYNQMRATPTSAIYTIGLVLNTTAYAPIRLSTTGASWYLVSTTAGDLYALFYVSSFSAEL